MKELILPNNLGLPYRKNRADNPVKNHPMNQKATSLLMQAKHFVQSENPAVFQLAFWILDSEQKLQDPDDNLMRALIVLKLETEPKNAMRYLNPKQKTLERRELMETFMETDDPELGAVTILKMIAMRLQESESELQTTNEILLDYPPEDILLILQIDYRRGLAKAKIGQYEAAIAEYDNAIRLEPDHANAYYNRGLAKYNLSQYEAAITDYDNAIRLKSDYAAAYYNRGLAKYNLSQYEASIDDYDNAIRFKPDYVNAYYERGNTKYILGQDEAAIVDYHNAIRLKPDDANAYYDRALAKCNLGQYEAAIDDYDNAIRLKPDDANAYYDRGLAKKKLGQTSGSEQDWRTALKLATQTGNVTLKNQIENVLPQFEPQIKAFESLTEKKVKEIVTDYFKSLRIASAGYSIKREYPIQMGSDRRRADIVFLRNGKLVAIAECKRTGRVENGNKQLHSYLCATDTFLGIFANDGDPNQWTFLENHRHNNFLEIDRETFENYIDNHDKAIKDREKKIKLEIEREIDTEIRARVRKNTDTNAIRQNETDRIKQEVIKNIDKTTIVNSVRSQIAQQAKNGLLNKRDEENPKFGRSQGFWWTILSIIGIGILIALLTSAA